MNVSKFASATHCAVYIDDNILTSEQIAHGIKSIILDDECIKLVVFSPFFTLDASESIPIVNGEVSVTTIRSAASRLINVIRNSDDNGTYNNCNCNVTGNPIA